MEISSRRTNRHKHHRSRWKVQEGRNKNAAHTQRGNKRRSTEKGRVLSPFMRKEGKRQPRHGPRLGELAVCELQSGLFMRAARSYWQAITKGDNSRNRYGYAGVLRLLGQVELSDLEIERAICMDFSKLNTHRNEGEIMTPKNIKILEAEKTSGKIV